MRQSVTAVLIVCAAAGAVSADYITLPAKWQQTPWDPDGVAWISDHNYPQVVAEDFACTDREPIVAVRWWGNYSLGYEPMEPRYVAFDISFHLSTGDHPTSLPVAQPVVLYQEVKAQEEWTGQYQQDLAVYRYDAYLPVPFDQWTWSQQSPNVGQLWIDICRPGQAGDPEWGWCTLLPSDPIVPILDWAAYSTAVDPHNGPWTSLASGGYPDTQWQLAFELMTPEPTTMALVGLGLAGLCTRRRTRK